MRLFGLFLTLDYFTISGGSACEANYPYVARQGWCRWNRGMKVKEEFQMPLPPCDRSKIEF